MHGNWFSVLENTGIFFSPNTVDHAPKYLHSFILPYKFLYYHINFMPMHFLINTPAVDITQPSNFCQVDGDNIQCY